MLVRTVDRCGYGLMSNAGRTTDRFGFGLLNDATADRRNCVWVRIGNDAPAVATACGGRLDIDATADQCGYGSRRLLGRSRSLRTSTHSGVGVCG